uniref:Variable large protein n=1 Tax=Rhabditophanes sp. KR3021 TaxID=114890 RepID=A0AC35TGH3_9BILA
MAGSAEAAKSLFDTVFNKTKEVVNNAADTTKGLANVMYENVAKIIPGQGNNPANVDPNAAPVGEGVGGGSNQAPGPGQPGYGGI